MKCVCIIDTDLKSLNDIRISLEQIDGGTKIFEFSDLVEFRKWINDTIKNQLENPKSEKYEIKLLVVDLLLIGPKYVEIFEELQGIFIRSLLCTEIDPTGFVVTTFESPLLDIKHMENLILSNILIKPFDKSILIQDLRIALTGHHSVIDSSVFKQKVKVQAEMLKEIQMEEFSEIGFKTKSERAIPLNSMAKYYSEDLFQSGRSYVYARCISCTPLTTGENSYIIEFMYFGLSNLKNKFIRQELFKKHDESILQPKNKFSITNNQKVKIILVQNDENTEIKEIIEKKYQNIQVDIVLEEENFVNICKNEKSIHAVLVNFKIFDKEAVRKWRQIADTNITKSNSGLIFLVCLTQEFDDASKIEFSDLVVDTIQIPMDRIYLFKRLSCWFPQLVSFEESVGCFKKKTDKHLQVANPVDLVEISEAGLSMRYHREIELNSFRRFSLGVTSDSVVPEILASCYYREKLGESYVIHFVFFGITDHYLKKIRKWILDSYIVSKQSA